MSLLPDLWESRSGGISTPVLKEFYVNVTRNTAKPLFPAKARGILSAHAAWKVEIIRPANVLQASEVEGRHHLSFWDAMIVVAAAIGGAGVIVTEDWNPGVVNGGLRVSNPFLCRCCRRVQGLNRGGNVSSSSLTRRTNGSVLRSASGPLRIACEVTAAADTYGKRNRGSACSRPSIPVRYIEATF